MHSFSYLEPVFCSMSSSTVASWLAYRFLKKQVRWSGIPISFRILQFVVIHTVKDFGVVNKIKIDVFMKLCFFRDSRDVGNLISGSSAFTKTNLNIWKFMVHVYLKPGFSNTWTVNSLMFKLVLEKAEKPENKLPISAGSSKKQESPRKTSISALFTMPKPLTVWIRINCGKFFKRWKYQTTWPASWETYMQVRK